MKRPAAVLLTCVILTPGASGISDIRRNTGILRVAIVETQREVKLSVKGDFVLRGLDGGKRSLLSDGNTYLAKARPDGSLVIGSIDFGTRVRVVPTVPDAELRIDGKVYRDA